jgi:hypothetical protein
MNNMKKSAISTVIAARSAPIAVASTIGGATLGAKPLQIWNWNTGELLSEFETVFDGCKRLAISPDGLTCVAANWRKGKNAGVACYDILSGITIWHRTDIRQVQHLRYSARGSWIWCEIDSRPAHCLDAKTGLTVTVWKGIREVVQDTNSGYTLAGRRGDFVIMGKKHVSVLRTPYDARYPWLFSNLWDAAFSSDAACLSEGRGPVRCLDCESGRERWRYIPPDGHSVIETSYQGGDHFHGILFDGYSTRLIRLSLNEGTCTEMYHSGTGARGFGFSIGAGSLVIWTGEVVSLKTGEVVRSLAFPREEMHHARAAVTSQ